MHGIRREDFYKTPEEEKAFSEKLKKGFKLLDNFVETVHQSELTIDSDKGILGDHEEADRMLELSADLNDFMPEFYPSWNYRKNYMLQGIIEPDKLRLLLLNELEYTENMLRKAPKCYAVWHHRLWVLTMLFNKKYEELPRILKKEVSLCMLFFRLDGRNFHAWSHMNFCRHYLNKLEPNEQSGDATETDTFLFKEIGKLIEKNFSNYSARFHRAALSETCGRMKDDVEMLTPAIYTDPNDQCLWHHFDWLLYHRNSLKHYLIRSHFLCDERTILFYFNEPVFLEALHSSLYVHDEQGNQKQVKGQWRPVARSTWSKKLGNCEVPQCLYKFVANETINTDEVEEVTGEIVIRSADDIVDSYYDHMTNNAKCKTTTDPEANIENHLTLIKLGYSLSPNNGHDLYISSSSPSIKRMKVGVESDWKDISTLVRRPIRLPRSSRIVSIAKEVTTEVFEEQLDMINSLIEMETESKYLFLARHKICSYLGMLQDTEQCYSTVKRLDPLRASMYNDLLVKEKVKDILDKAQSSGSCSASLSGLGLKNLCYSDIAPYVTLRCLDLSQNCLSERALIDFGIDVMLGLQHLNLAKNCFKSLFTLLAALTNLRRLVCLDISGNPIETLDIEEIKLLPRSLRKIDITDTPLLAQLLQNEQNEDYPSANAVINTPMGEFRLCVDIKSCIKVSRGGVTGACVKTKRFFLRRGN